MSSNKIAAREPAVLRPGVCAPAPYAAEIGSGAGAINEQVAMLRMGLAKTDELLREIESYQKMRDELLREVESCREMPRAKSSGRDDAPRPDPDRARENRGRLIVDWFNLRRIRTRTAAPLGARVVYPSRARITRPPGGAVSTKQR